MRRLFLIAAAALLLQVAAASATSVPVGVISYDQYFNVGTGSTVVVFDINSFVGDPSLGGSALPPNFNVFTPLTINNATLTLSGPSAPSSPISLGTILPGYLSDAFGNPLSILQFSLASSFTSALLQGTLSTTTLTLSDGSVVTVQPTISVLMTSGSGTTLVPNLFGPGTGGDFAVINAASSVSTVPEPGTLLLILPALAALFGLKVVALRGALSGGK